jgi:predicted CxxxxCH...CXXCH cytochrome family protein
VTWACARGLWAKAFALCDLPEAACSLGVCHGNGYGAAAADLLAAEAWYQAAMDCDLTGAVVGDKPVAGAHGDLREMAMCGPTNQGQAEFIQQAAGDHRNLMRRKLAEERGGAGFVEPPSQEEILKQMADLKAK